MRALWIEVPEGVARDLIAPNVPDAPTEQRRADAQEELAELIRNALARSALTPAIRTSTLLAAASTDLAGHIGHHVALTEEGGVITEFRCEDCDVTVEVRV